MVGWMRREVIEMKSWNEAKIELLSEIRGT